ncbi:BTAD domain-containing putative transcriptional regulator [Nonomuraea sp. NPDC050680]|uniref:AfsR/SARP family transcriptional regulator n=1 Tax=Nonomuraea sp. NPDC050680 TaxID=3154630 RepID=UPI0033D55F2F
MALQFHVLGPLRVFDDGDELQICANRELAILASLVLNANRVVSVDRLIETVWAGSAPQSAGRQVAICVSRLRRTLGAAAIETSSPGYLLRVSAENIDWLRFGALVARARGQAAGGAREDAVRLLREALTLWRGNPFEDIRGLRYDVARMEESRLEALEACLELEIDLGHHHRVIPELLALVAECPFRERVRAQLMLAQYRAGRRAEALRTYQETRRYLLEQIGLEPGPALRRLHDQVLRDESGLMRPAAHRPSGAGPVVPSQLPPQVLPYVGRTGELAALDAALRPEPEVAVPGTMVLSGPRGVGKSALALRWAHARIDWFPDGQLYADMRGVSAAAVLDRFLRALGVPGQDIPLDPAEKLALYRSCTARRRLLVVLDDVKDSAQVLPLLPGGANCRVIVTSADPLDDLVARQGAHREFVRPLPAEAARELADMLVGAPYTPTVAQAVTDLVATSSGNPLSVRLGAAQMRTRARHHHDLARMAPNAPASAACDAAPPGERQPT